MNSISVIVITLNESQRIANILSDIANQTFKSYEVIVVDSNSDDDTREIAKSFTSMISELTVYRMKERGVSLGRNTGVKLAKYERLLFLDADVRLKKDFIMKSVNYLRKNEIKVAGVYLEANDVPKLYRLGYAVFNFGMKLTQNRFPTAVGACIFSTKSIHTEIGGFDQTITLCEDCDYVKRASKLTKFCMMPFTFEFDARRLRQDGCLYTGYKYLHANIHRAFIGEIRNHKINYKFDHYSTEVNKTHNNH